MSDEFAVDVVRIIQAKFAELDNEPRGAAGFDEGYDTGRYEMLCDLSREFADFFGEESSHFDKEKFLTDCGV